MSYHQTIKTQDVPQHSNDDFGCGWSLTSFMVRAALQAEERAKELHASEIYQEHDKRHVSV